MTEIVSFTKSAEVLPHTQTALEQNEAAISFILGLYLRLRDHPDPSPGQVCLKAVEDKHGLALTAIMTHPHNLILSGQVSGMESIMAPLVSELVQEGWTIPGVLAPFQLACSFVK